MKHVRLVKYFLVLVSAQIIYYYYCPQTKFAKVMFLQVFVCPQGAGGMHGCSGLVGGHAWLLPGGCAW